VVSIVRIGRKRDFKVDSFDVELYASQVGCGNPSLQATSRQRNFLCSQPWPPQRMFGRQAGATSNTSNVIVVGKVSVRS
jgi:hypothetical protein